MNLSDLFEETTTGTLPPTRVDAGTAYRDGVRRRRVALATRASLVVVPILALVAALIVVVRPGGDPETADRPPASTWLVHQVGGFNQKRLWAYVEPCKGCGYELRTSNDGGRKWSKFVVQESVLRQPVMTSAAGGVALLVSPSTVRVSTDGWGSFHDVAFAPVPVSEAPPDAPVYCNTEPYATDKEHPSTVDPGTVRIVDINSGRMGPAPAQPPFHCRAAVRVPGGVMLAAGQDPATGRPVVARSTDNGVTWDTTVLPWVQVADLVASPVVVDLIGSPGGAAVVVFRQGSSSGLFRFDSGDWQRVGPTGPQPDRLILARDNTLLTWTMVGAETAYTINRPGGTGFEPVGRPAGIGQQPVVDAGTLPDGSYVAFNDNRIWTSGDGRSWKAVSLG